MFTGKQLRPGWRWWRRAQQRRQYDDGAGDVGSSPPLGRGPRGNDDGRTEFSEEIEWTFDGDAASAEPNALLS